MCVVLFDVFCEQRQSGTLLEKIRGARGGQKPSSHPLAMIGFFFSCIAERARSIVGQLLET